MASWQEMGKITSNLNIQDVCCSWSVGLRPEMSVLNKHKYSTMGAPLTQLVAHSLILQITGELDALFAQCHPPLSPCFWSTYCMLYVKAQRPKNIQYMCIYKE